MRTFKTETGLELQIDEIKGKDYLKVAERIRWFRHEKKDWQIHTSFHTLNGDIAIARAEISNEKGEVISSAHKTETPRGFPDYVEKAETGAIGRALAHLGYGTQFCGDELDEGERLADSPRERPSPTSVYNQASNNSVGAEDWVVDFGKFKNKRFADIPVHEAKNYADYLKKSAREKGKPMGGSAAQFVQLAQKLQNGQQAPGDVPPDFMDEIPF